MRDWATYVRDQLREARPALPRADRVTRELAEQLEDFYRDAMARGLTEGEADEYARSQVTDWEQLAREVQQADRPPVRQRLTAWSRELEPGRIHSVRRGFGDLGDRMIGAPVRPIPQSPNHQITK